LLTKAVKIKKYAFVRLQKQQKEKSGPLFASKSSSSMCLFTAHPICIVIKAEEYLYSNACDYDGNRKGLLILSDM
jgi:hypothetical protein